MVTLSYPLLTEAVASGGPSCLSATTELAPAGGPHSAVAPARFVRGRDSVYAYERRYLDGELRHAVVIDSKQSQLNRAESGLVQAIRDGHPVLSRLPHVTLQYERDGQVETYFDLTLPHRVYDGHIRAGTVDGRPITEDEAYRAVRDATPLNARPLLETSPVTLVFGGWDSTRRSRQGRWRSALVGEVIGFVAGNGDGKPVEPGSRGGARVDPVGMQVQLAKPAMKALADAQRAELSPRTYDEAVKRNEPSRLGLGGIPPSLDALGGVACDRIIRTHVLSFATLRQMRFGGDPEGDVACRALLAALALSGLARADAELYLRANCDLVEAGPTDLRIDRRGGEFLALEPLDLPAADALLAEALSAAEERAGVVWQGVALEVTGNPAVVSAAVEGEGGEES